MLYIPAYQRPHHPSKLVVKKFECVRVCVCTCVCMYIPSLPRGPSNLILSFSHTQLKLELKKKTNAIYHSVAKKTKRRT